MIHILSCKHLSSKQKKPLKKLGIQITSIDFISTEYLFVKCLPVSDIYFFSSINAVESICKHPNIEQIKSKKCYCVGKKTYQRLKKHLFNVIQYYDSAEKMTQHIHKFNTNDSVTYFCGNIRQNIIPNAFSKYFSVYQEVIVYNTHLTPHNINFSPDAVLFFSPSGVHSFMMKNNLLAPAFCIGKTTALPLIEMNKQVFCSDFPSVEATINKCIEYFSQNIEDQTEITSPKKNKQIKHL